MVNLVIVSHSSRLGEGVGELARQMLMSDSCKIAIAAGIDDPQNPIGTDAVKVWRPSNLLLMPTMCWS